jgi:hypothetical protein
MLPTVAAPRKSTTWFRRGEYGAQMRITEDELEARIDAFFDVADRVELTISNVVHWHRSFERRDPEQSGAQPPHFRPALASLEPQRSFSWDSSSSPLTCRARDSPAVVPSEHLATQFRNLARNNYVHYIKGQGYRTRETRRCFARAFSKLRNGARGLRCRYLRRSTDAGCHWHIVGRARTML